MYTAPRSQGVYFHPRELEGSESVKDDEAGAALEDEMFKVRRKRNVARNAINPTDVLVAGALSDDNLFQTAPYGYSLDV